MDPKSLHDPFAIHFTTFTGDVYTLDTASITLSAGTLTAAAGIFTGVVQATDFAKTGWPITSGVTLSFVNGTRIFTVTDGGSAFYYVDGVKYTLGGNKTVTIDDTEGLWYIYFVGSTLTASQTPWDIAAEDKAQVSILYWDATNNEEIFLSHELHTFHMSGATHERLHEAGGTAFESGLLVQDVGGENIDVDLGEIHDEDLHIAITDGAGSGLYEQVLSPAELPIYYRDGASDWRIHETGDKANATDVGFVDGTNNLEYNKLNGTWASVNVTAARHVAYWVIATNDQTAPVCLIMGQREDTTLANAKENNVFSGLSLSGLPFEEMVLLARLILKETGGGIFYTLEEVLDLRGFNQTGNITTPLITDHGGLGGLGDDDHAQYWIAGAARAGNFETSGTTTAEKFIGWGVAPIGSVMSWLKSFTNTPALPDGWLEANGQALTGGAAEPDSPYNGQTLPNLNASGGGTKRFLRGSTTSGTTGGSETHNHGMGEASACQETSQCLTQPELALASHVHVVCMVGTLPSFYEVVRIMRIK